MKICMHRKFEICRCEGNVSEDFIPGSVSYFEGDIKAFEADFYLTRNDDYDPVLACEIKVNPKTASNWPEYLITSQVQGSLHYGIFLARKILSSFEDKEFTFYRHGNDICRFVREVKESSSVVGNRI